VILYALSSLVWSYKKITIKSCNIINLRPWNYLTKQWSTSPWSAKTVESYFWSFYHW